MSKAREIQNFFYGQYFADGMRISIGTLVPALVFSYFGNLQMGTTVSAGALVIGLSDLTGPSSHRRNGMLICTVLVLITSLITNLVSPYPVLMVVAILAMGFFYSMFAVFGSRAATIGAMGLLAMILNTEVSDGSFYSAAETTFFVFMGCLWYMFLSISMTQVRPYRLAQQELGESIHHVADYIRLKSNFYDDKSDNQKNFFALIDQQVLVNEHQESVREMVYRSKQNIKDTTKIGRVLILIFSDIVDLFEQSMATHYDYDAIQEKYGHTGILNQLKISIIRVANELDHLGYEINANRIPKPLYNFKQDLEKLFLAIDQVEKDHNISTLPLKKVLINIRTMSQRIQNIYGYFDRNPSRSLQIKEDVDYSKFIDKNPIDLSVLRQNIHLKSSTFRHAIRMAIVMAAGYLISQQLYDATHSNWILLTILVILKPGFGLTKQRNFQRLTGTIIGGIGGAIIVLLVQDEVARFFLLMFFMIATYSLLRINYIISVMFMTPYVLILFSFFEQNVFLVMQDRILETLIGSGLAFFSSYIIFPNWERNRIQGPMYHLLVANYHYIGNALKIIAGEKLEPTTLRLASQEVHISTANMGSAFQRLITEPKMLQKNAAQLNKFVVFNHILSSYSVTLLNNVSQADETALTGNHVRLIRKVLYQLGQTIQLTAPPEEKGKFKEIDVQIPENIDANNIDSPDLRLITEQLEFIYRIVGDIHKTCEKMDKGEEK